MTASDARNNTAVEGGKGKVGPRNWGSNPRRSKRLNRDSFVFVLSFCYYLKFISELTKHFTIARFYSQNIGTCTAQADFLLDHSFPDDSDFFFVSGPCVSIT